MFKWMKVLKVCLLLALVGIMAGSVALAEENFDVLDQTRFHILLGMKDSSLRENFMQSQIIQIKSFFVNEDINYSDLGIGSDREISFSLSDSHQDARIKELFTSMQEQIPDILLRRDRLSYSIVIPEKTLLWVKENAIQDAVEVIKNRLAQFGLAGQTVLSKNKKEIVVEMQGLKTDERARVLRLITSQGVLQLIKMSEQRKKTVPIVFASSVGEAKVSFDDDSQPIVEYTLRTSDAKRVADFVSKNPGKNITVLLNGKTYSTFGADSLGNNGEGRLSGNLTVQDAHDLAIILRSGGLLAPLQVIKKTFDKDAEKTINDCKTKVFRALQLSAVQAFENGDQQKSLKLFKKAYHICPADKMTKDMIEELEREVGNVH